MLQVCVCLKYRPSERMGSSLFDLEKRPVFFALASFISLFEVCWNLVIIEKFLYDN